MPKPTVSKKNTSVSASKAVRLHRRYHINNSHMAPHSPPKPTRMGSRFSAVRTGMNWTAVSTWNSVSSQSVPARDTLAPGLVRWRLSCSSS